MKKMLRANCPFFGGLVGHAVLSVLSDIGVNMTVSYIVGIAVGIVMWKGLAYSLSEEKRA